MQAAGATQAEAEVRGVVDSILFANPENGYCVFHARPAKGIQLPAGLDWLTIVGHAGAVSKGERVTAAGQWVHDRRFGLQFHARTIRVSPPVTESGIRAYLQSGLIKGVGKKTGDLLFAKFGKQVFHVIEHEPHRLTEISGIGENKAKSITRSWAAHNSIRDIIVFLGEHGISASRATRIHKAYGDKAIAAIRDNPYRLCHDIQGIGFLIADRIAMGLGYERTAHPRLRAGLVYALEQAAAGNGHTGLPYNELVGRAAELLGVPSENILGCLRKEELHKRLLTDRINEETCVFIPRFYHAEKSIAERLMTLANGLPPWDTDDTDSLVSRIEKELSLSLANAQRDALRLAAKSKVCVITGGPGTGKSTLVDAILRLPRRQMKVALCAPTGRAAKRIWETTKKEAKTIHRLLGVDPATGQFSRNRDNPLDADIVVVDEGSMIDVMLFAALLDAIPDRAALIIIGDVDQLPPVGPGDALANIIDSGAIPVVRLTEIFRQAAQSRIITSAHQINKGIMPDNANAEPGSDFFFVPADNADAAAQTIASLVSDRLPLKFGIHPVNDIQVLTPMHKTAAGTASLNALLQRALNPNADRHVERAGVKYALYDKVLVNENDYERDIYNGDIGLITELNDADKEITVTIDGRRIKIGYDELDILSHAYATTIHKSQGSQYRAVVIPLVTQHHVMLARPLIYTAITRGEQLVVLVGQRRALEMAVDNSKTRNRITRLKQILIRARDDP